MTLILLTTAIVLLGCVLLNNWSNRIGVPYLLAFILLGILFGSEGAIRIAFDDTGFAEKICSCALIFIMFYGGFGVRWKTARKTAAPAFVLASTGVVLTALLTACFCHFILRMNWAVSLLTGSVISSTDAASVFAVLRSKRLNLKYGTASLLEMESGSNDPASYLMTILSISLLNGSLSGSELIKLVLRQILFGILIGYLIALLAVWILRHIRFANEGFDLVFVCAIALLTYALPSLMGGNGYLAVYIAGILIGNADFSGRKRLVHFFEGATGLCQILIFFTLGLLCAPSLLIKAAPTGTAIALVLIFLIRPLVILAIGRFYHMPLNQILFISWAGLRGASSIVFAMMAVNSVNIPIDLFSIVFVIVLISILLQGSLLPASARKLHMLDEHEDVMKTFSDYTEETPVEFIRVPVSEQSGWNGKTLAEIALPPSSLAVMVQRGDQQIVPDGSVRLYAGDEVILTALSAKDHEVAQIIQMRVEHEDSGKRLKDISRKKGLVILIRRGNQSFIPNGNTPLREGDELLIHQSLPN